MGSSEWHHIVAFEPDIAAVLVRLQEAEFAAGEYFWEGDGVDGIDRPESIEALLDDQPASGTHSIIDMFEGVSDEPRFGVVAPLSEAQLMTAFDTLHPDLDAVRRWAQSSAIDEWLPNWYGVYVIAGPPEAPTGICFAGFSGD